MKKLLLIATLFAFTSGFTAPSPAAPEETKAPDAPAANDAVPDKEEPVKDVFPRFTVVGDWHVTHPWWVDTLTLRADGTLYTHRQGTTGRWILTGDGGTPVIVIRWDVHGTESVAMVTPNHFRGQIRNGRFMDMQREEQVAEEKAPGDSAPAAR